jgi:catechol 2,3-dioxygenase-like lactoylglutathione lyase family enzyme
MRAVALLLTGLFLGASLQSPLAQPAKRGIIGLNHVGISVEKFEEVKAFYMKMGFREIYSRPGPDGPTISFLQIGPDTFIELTKASANAPTGLAHFGLRVDDMTTAVNQLKQAGMTVQDVRKASSADLVTNATDPFGVRMEILEIGPESLQGKAIASWR